MIDPGSFAEAMEAFAPFEACPAIAVAVSGGPDSMALLLLLDRWTRERGGSVIGLTVEHGLRPESADEASQVGLWLRARGIAHEILTWRGDKPATGVQSAARDARYALLTDACQARGLLHLAVAHHADDQAETVLLRRQRRSGGDGLAGMPAARSLGAVRLIRPLLGWPKAALVRTCVDLGQDFAQDPSNHADSYARTHLRRRLDADKDQRTVLLAAASEAAAARIRNGGDLADLLAATVEIRPDGAILIDPARLSALAPRPRLAILSAALRTGGGMRYAPPVDAVARVDARLWKGGFTGASLGGCVIRPWRGSLLLCREPGRVEPPIELIAGRWRRWDERFILRVRDQDAGSRRLQAGALGQIGYARLKRLIGARFPAIHASGLPAVRSGDMLLSVPSLGWSEEGAPVIEQRYAPLWPLSPETFTVVYAGPDIIFDKDTRNRRQSVDFDPRLQNRFAV